MQPTRSLAPFLLSVSLLTHLFLLGSSCGGTEQPNILLILTDDQGWPTLGCYGGEHVATPHLDRLAAQGVRFTDAYVTSQCTPTRATILTGQYTARHGLWHVLSWYGYPYARMTEPMFAEDFPRNQMTIGKALQGAGYRTAIVGKWHLTSNSDGNYMGLHPQASHHYGFDHAPPVITKEYFEAGGDRGVRLLTEQAISFIGEGDDQPWFCFLSHHMIHGKVVAPEKIVQRYRAKGYGEEGPNRAVYLAGLECIDNSMGLIVEHLEATGQLNNTVIIFLSDNGGVYERLDFRGVSTPHPPSPTFTTDLVEYSNKPLRAGKGSVYEGGVRVPMLIHWPDGFKTSRVINTPVHAIDIFPTCLSIATAAEPQDGRSILQAHPLDGANLVTLMRDGHDDLLTSRPLFQYYPFYDLRWGLTPSVSVRLGSMKLIRFFGDSVNLENQYRPGHRLELYDLSVDIGESNNLVNRMPEVAAEMDDILDRWITSVGAQQPQLNAHHNSDTAFFETREKPPWLQDTTWSATTR